MGNIWQGEKDAKKSSTIDKGVILLQLS